MIKQPDAALFIEISCRVFRGHPDFPTGRSDIVDLIQGIRAVRFHMRSVFPEISVIDSAIARTDINLPSFFGIRINRGYLRHPQGFPGIISSKRPVFYRKNISVIGIPINPPVCIRAQPNDRFMIHPFIL